MLQYLKSDIKVEQFDDNGNPISPKMNQQLRLRMWILALQILKEFSKMILNKGICKKCNKMIRYNQKKLNLENKQFSQRKA